MYKYEKLSFRRRKEKMSSTSKKRPKPKANAKPPLSPDSSVKYLTEPPPNFFPSKSEILRLVTVLAIATSVALGCNFLATTLVNRQPKPFCDSRDLDSPDTLSGSGEYPSIFPFFL